MEKCFFWPGTRSTCITVFLLLDPRLPQSRARGPQMDPQPFVSVFPEQFTAPPLPARNSVFIIVSHDVRI